MVCTSAIRNLIRQAKTHQIYSLMQDGEPVRHVHHGPGPGQAGEGRDITEGVALDRCRNEEDLRSHLHIGRSHDIERGVGEPWH